MTYVLWCKITALCLAGFLSGSLFIWSLCVDYQYVLEQEHVRFRSGFPSQANWMISPHGTLSSYLFNWTNAEAFLSGKDKKVKLQQIGPIVYRVKGRCDVLNQTDNSLTFHKVRYDRIEFDAKASSAPNILNQTIVMPNLMLLGAAAKFHDWTAMVRFFFNGITVAEPVFLTESVNYFLWNYTRPGLNLLSKYAPNIVSNCGMLYRATHTKREIYNVKIGLDEGMKNFFRVNTLNKMTTFEQHSANLKYLNKQKYPDLYCPIEVKNAFDNSVFPPMMNKYDPITIVAGESCRTLNLKYNTTEEHLGFSAYQYIITDEPVINSCLNFSMGIKLHSRMFDVSKCLVNDVPAAFSSPHFYGSSYKWEDHYEGFAPNRELHEASITIEPITGIPLKETYRFQSNIPMPDLTGYNKNLERFSNMVVPSFWYSYALDDLPWIVLFLMRLNIFVMPIAQPIFTIMFLFAAVFCFLKCFLIYKQITFKDFFKKFIMDKISKKSLETDFESSCKEKEIEIEKM